MSVAVVSLYNEQRTRELYEAALTRPPNERSSYVAEVAGLDSDLRERVEALLAGQQDTELPGCEAGSDRAQPPLGAGTFIGSYRIEGPIGAGGMGVVYLATDTKLNRPAAIKVLAESVANAEALRRFQREARVVSSLNHPHIVTVYDAGEYQGRQYLITEYVDGGTLRQWAQHPRGWRAVLDLLVGVADATAVAHEAGILHRDLKPENILLATNGYAKLADFGIAKLLENDPAGEDPGLQRAGGHSTQAGTVAYMSPEQRQGLPLDARSDVYSFGLLLQELLAGKRPEKKEPAGGVTLPPLPADLPGELRALVAKALEPEPAARYSSMRDLVIDLRRVARHPSLEAGARLSTPRVRARARAIGYAMAALAALVIVGWFGREELSDWLGNTPTRLAIAVLPFVTEGANAGDDSISERLGDKLRDRLQELARVDVIGRVSSLSFRDERGDIPGIARALRVDRLVDGSLRRRGELIEVRIEILNERGFALRTLSFEEPDTALLALQQRIVAEVAAFLDPASTAGSPLVQSERANRLILVGSHLEHEVKDDISIDSEKLRRAVDYYRQATQADPTSIEAHSRLASALLYDGEVEEAGVALRRAIELGRSLAPSSKSIELSDVHATAALYLTATRQEGADGELERALALAPQNVEAMRPYAQWLMAHNRSFEAQQYFEAAIRLEPLSLTPYLDYAEYLGIRDEIGPLRELAREIGRLFPNARGYLTLARVYELAGDLDVGIAYGLQSYRLLTAASAGPTPAPQQLQLIEDARGQIAELYARIGDFDEASMFEPEPGIGQLLLRGRYRELGDVAQERMISFPDDLDAQHYLAFAYNATGDFRNAKYLLEQLGFPLAEGNFRSGSEAQAPSYYIDALQSLGGNEAAAAELARRRVENFSAGTRTGMARSWWVNLWLACGHAQLGQVSAAIPALDRIREARGLAMLPLLQDSPCFKRLAAEPSYIELVAHLNERQRELRERLPATLREYGVADVRP